MSQPSQKPTLSISGGNQALPTPKPQKVPLERGYSLADWTRLTHSNKHLGSSNGQLRRISLAEVAEHDSEDDCWTVLRGKVYDITPYLRYHPGGVSELMRGAGQDCTMLFDITHGWVNGDVMLQSCLIGFLDRTSGSGSSGFPQAFRAPAPKLSAVAASGSTSTSTSGSGTHATGLLHPSEWRHFTLKEKEQLTHNSFRFRFGLPKEDDVLNLPIGQHISLRTEVKESIVIRSYTPTSTHDMKGCFDLVIKIYPLGKMSQHVHHMAVGETIEMRGPKGSFKYQPNQFKQMGMIAGGTGITPMYQVLQYIVNNPEDHTRVSVLFANVTEDDILLKEQLEALQAKRPDQVQLTYVLDKPPSSNWTGETGFITTAMIQKYMPPPAPETVVCLCGPPPMIQALNKHLSALSYTQPMIFRF